MIYYRRSKIIAGLMLQTFSGVGDAIILNYGFSCRRDAANIFQNGFFGELGLQKNCRVDAAFILQDRHKTCNTTITY